MIRFVGEVQGWHEDTWPDASDDLVMVKLAEECGEVAQLIGKRTGDRGLVLEELADVVIVAVALARRFGSVGEFERALWEKFDRVRA